jgi:hypothetical protein
MSQFHRDLVITHALLRDIMNSISRYSALALAGIVGSTTLPAASQGEAPYPTGPSTNNISPKKQECIVHEFREMISTILTPSQNFVVISQGNTKDGVKKLTYPQRAKFPKKYMKAPIR